jgi:hypothetical protein
VGTAASVHCVGVAGTSVGLAGTSVGASQDSQTVTVTSMVVYSVTVESEHSEGLSESGHSAPPVGETGFVLVVLVLISTSLQWLVTELEGETSFVVEVEMS